MGTVPIAVQKQAEEARKLAEELMSSAQEETPPKTEEDNATPPEEGSPPSTPEAEETPTQDAETTEGELEGAPPEEDPKYWEHKYSVLQGKYNAEVPRLHEELKSVRQDNEYLKGKLELLERLVTEQQKTTPSKQTETPQESEPEPPEVAQLREDFPDIYKGVVKLVERLVAKQEQIEQKLTTTEETIAQTNARLFYRQLAEEVPDWEEINVSPQFLEWLKQVDPYSGMTKHELLIKAFQEGDAGRVARFFKDFKAEVAPEPPAKPNERNVVPPQGKASSSTPGRVSGKIYKQSDVEEFYRQVALGNIPKEQAKAKEMDIIKAMREGRVIFNQ